MLGIRKDIALTPPDQIGPGALAEWQAAPAVLEIVVFDLGRAMVTYDSHSRKKGPLYSDWHITKSSTATHAPPLLDKLNAFREKNTIYLNYLPDSMPHLADYQPTADWTSPDSMVTSEEHVLRWQATELEPSLWQLAKRAHVLYDAVFPRNTELRKCIDELPMGSLLDIKWLKETPGHVANFPWGLLYLRDPPHGRPVDPMLFWGMRFRIDYDTYQVQEKNKALGRMEENHVGHAHYWHGQSDEEALKEAEWQKSRCAEIPNHVCIPDLEAERAPKDQLLDWLREPSPAPQPVLYLFCRACVDGQRESKLEFGSGTEGTMDWTVSETELPLQPFSFPSLVFCNSCGSGMQQSAYALNRIEEHFFRRGCAAYVGTVHQIPVRLASRFAATFFHFFCGRKGEITSAGEALTQARRFLWLKYRNIGGLFYTYVNEFELYLTDSKELEEARRRFGGPR